MKTQLKVLVPGGGVEPPRYQVPADFESAASASSAIPAQDNSLNCSILLRVALWLLLFLSKQSARHREAIPPPEPQCESGCRHLRIRNYDSVTMQMALPQSSTMKLARGARFSCSRRQLRLRSSRHRRAEVPDGRSLFPVPSVTARSSPFRQTVKARATTQNTPGPPNHGATGCAGQLCEPFHSRGSREPDRCLLPAVAHE